MGNKKSILENSIQAAATILLVVLVFFMMNYVNDVQGTARVVNYAGLVRGETQRVVKLEISGIESDDKISELDQYIDGIQNGSDELGLIKIEEEDYQKKVKELHNHWKSLKEEIINARMYGADKTDIVAMSEEYFDLSNEIVNLTEVYSQKCATRIHNMEGAVNIVIVVIIIMMIKQTIAIIRSVRQNRELKNKVYIDEHTGLPNKNKCEELLELDMPIDVPIYNFMFDLNNLKYVNDSMGHDAGDTLILDFSRFIRKNVPEQYFVGRYGGDEFIAVITDADEDEVKNILHKIKIDTDSFNKSGSGIPISYAVGYAYSGDFEQCTMRSLLAEADKNMYVNKKTTKKEAADVEKQVDIVLSQMINAIGRIYTDCCYCNINTDSYRLFKKGEESLLPNAGIFSEKIRDFINKYVAEENRQDMMYKLSAEYIKSHLDEENQTYTVAFKWFENSIDRWWQATVMFVDKDDSGKLFHYIVAFEENTEEIRLEYEARHDGLTGLLNKKTAFLMIDTIAASKPDKLHAIMVMDFDNFKLINDNYGHSEGDAALIKMGSLISRTFRKQDIIARFGGDEFIVFLTDISGTELLTRKAQSIIDSTRKEFSGQYSTDVTVSIGIACSEMPIKSDELFDAADKALYEAKRSGKNKYICHETI